MTEELWIIVSAILPLIVAGSILNAAKEKLGVFHVMVLMVSIYYGALTIVSVLFVDVDGIDIFSVALVMIMVSATMVTSHFFYNCLPRKQLYYLSFGFLICRARKISMKSAIVLFAVYISWRAFVYLFYGIINQFNEARLSIEYGINIPHWVGPVNNLSNAIAFGVFVAFLARLLGKPVKDREFWLTVFMVATIGILLALVGRRMALNLIVMAGLMRYYARNTTANLITIANLCRVFAAILAIALFSNFYQVIRLQYLQHSAINVTRNEHLNLFDESQNFEYTEKNLAARVPVWLFHYWIMEQQLSSPTNILYGEVTTEALLSTIPRLLYDEKGAASKDDVIICAHYLGMCPHYHIYGEFTDYPRTIYSVLQADFGPLVMFAVPTLTFLLLIMLAKFAAKAERMQSGGIQYIAVFGITAITLFSVEQNIADYFVAVRHGIMISIIFWMIALIPLGRRISVA